MNLERERWCSGKKRGQRHRFKSKICKLIIVVIMVTVITSVIFVQFTVYFKVHLKSFQSKVNMIVTVVSNTIKCFFFVSQETAALTLAHQHGKHRNDTHPFIPSFIQHPHTQTHGKSPASKPEVMKKSAVTRTLAHIPHFVPHV